MEHDTCARTSIFATSRRGVTEAPYARGPACGKRFAHLLATFPQERQSPGRKAARLTDTCIRAICLPMGASKSHGCSKTARTRQTWCTALRCASDGLYWRDRNAAYGPFAAPPLPMHSPKRVWLQDLAERPQRAGDSQGDADAEDRRR